MSQYIEGYTQVMLFLSILGMILPGETKSTQTMRVINTLVFLPIAGRVLNWW